MLFIYFLFHIYIKKDGKKNLTHIHNIDLF